MGRQTKSELFSYSGAMLGQNILYNIHLQFIAYYFTQELMLSYTAASAIILSGQILGALFGTYMGYRIDRRSTGQKDKYRPLLITVTILLPLFMLLMFSNPGQFVPVSIMVRTAYAAITAIPFGLMYALSDLPLFGFPLVMTSSLSERNNLVAGGRLAANIAQGLVALLIIFKSSIGWFKTMVLYCAVSALVMIPASFILKERIHHQADGAKPKQVFSSLLHNRNLVVCSIMSLLLVFTNAPSTLNLYFSNYNLGNENYNALLLLLTLMAGMAASLCTPFLLRRMSKKRLFVVSCLITAALSIMQYALGYSNLFVFSVLFVVRNFFFSIPQMMIFFFFNDCIIFNTYTFKVQSEGLIYTLQMSLMGLGAGLATSFYLSVLQWFGADPTVAVQTTQVTNSLWATMMWTPTIGLVVCAIIIAIFYNLTEDTVVEMERYNNTNAS